MIQCIESRHGAGAGIRMTSKTGQVPVLLLTFRTIGHGEWVGIETNSDESYGRNKKGLRCPMGGAGPTLGGGQ